MRTLTPLRASSCQRWIAESSRLYIPQSLDLSSQLLSWVVMVGSKEGHVCSRGKHRTKYVINVAQVPSKWELFVSSHSPYMAWAANGFPKFADRSPLQVLLGPPGAVLPEHRTPWIECKRGIHAQSGWGRVVCDDDGI